MITRPIKTLEFHYPMIQVLTVHHISLIVNIVDVRFGRRDAEDHLFIRIGDDWNGDKKSGLIYGHVSLYIPSYFCRDLGGTL